ncbi:MAG: hypothetical protein ACK8QZ_07560, partial [Anaerolineales bacterium]
MKFVAGEMFDLFFGLALKGWVLTGVRLHSAPFGQAVAADVYAGEGTARHFLREDNAAALHGGFGGGEVVQ